MSGFPSYKRIQKKEWHYRINQRGIVQTPPDWVVSLNCRDEVLPRNTTQYELHEGRKSPDCLAVQAGGEPAARCLYRPFGGVLSKQIPSQGSLKLNINWLRVLVVYSYLADNSHHPKTG